MGRSVDYLSNATRVLYISYETEYEDEDGNIVDDEFAFDDVKCNVISTIRELFPSFDNVENRWDGNETKIFLENRLIEFGISEYCGLISISARPNDYANEYGKHGLAEAFINKIWNKLSNELNKTQSVLVRVGGFCNGCGVYQKID
jgi:hypothetical protein